MDCGICIFCKDKPKFGGPGKRKQCCELKKCGLISSKGNNAPVIPPEPKLEHIHNNTIESFLQSSGRKICPILGDGNCLFRTISYAFLNTEDYHYSFRSHIVRLINLNSKVFSHYLMPINQPTISEHLHHMIRPSTWGTHLEVKAAATLFRFPIYFCTKSREGSSFDWNAIQPIPPENIRFPLIMDEPLENEPLEKREDITHIEMYHHQSHYEAIVSIENNKVCRIPPKLTGKDDQHIIEL